MIGFVTLGKVQLLQMLSICLKVTVEWKLEAISQPTTISVKWRLRQGLFLCFIFSVD